MSENGTTAELRDWACVSADNPLVSPGLGKRLRGTLYGAVKPPDGSRIRQTDQVVRAEGLVVEFPSGNKVRLGTPNKDYRAAIDKRRALSGRTPIDWDNPFSATPAGGVDPATLAALIDGVRAPAPAVDQPNGDEPSAERPSRGRLWFLTAPFASLLRLLPAKKNKKKQKSKAKKKGPSALPSRTPARSKTRS